MKKILLSLPFILLVASCKMHVFYLKSNINAAIAKSDYGNETDSTFVFENDTIKVIYNLWDNRGKMHFAIYNKLNIPLFIDWKNSAFILDDQPHPYWIDKTNTKSSGSGAYYGGMSSYSSKGEAIKDDRVSFIPPQSKIIRMHVLRLSDHIRPTGMDYEKHFRNYIAYSVNEDTHGENFADASFQVTQIKRIGFGKKRAHESQMRFYTTK